MAKYSLDKKGRQRWRTNKTDAPAMQWTVQGEPINNHQGRRGTKGSKVKCRCEICTRNTKEAKEKIAQKEFEKEVKENTLNDKE